MPDKLKAMLKTLQESGVFLDENEPIARCRFADNNNTTRDGERREFDPLDEDDNFLYATYRALSMTLVFWRGLVLDFTLPNVLKKSVKLLQGQTVYTDHDTRVENWMGSVVQTKWDESTDIPPGINSRLKLNKKWSTPAKNDIILGVKLGTIHSVSVVVTFEYKKSHPDLEYYDFISMQGEEINGEVVRLIVTKIIGYDEESLVWQGADGYAKQQRKGQFSDDEGTGLKPEKIPPVNNNGGKTVKLSRLFAQLFRLDPEKYGLTAGKEEITLDEAGQAMLMGDLVRENTRQQNQYDQLTALLREFVGETVVPEKFKDALSDLKGKATMGEKYVEEVRNDALAYAKLAEGKSGDEKFGESALGKMIHAADLETALQFRDDYRTKAEEAFPLSCPQCGTKLSRASASRNDEGTGVEDPVSPDKAEFEI